MRLPALLTAAGLLAATALGLSQVPPTPPTPVAPPSTQVPPPTASPRLAPQLATRGYVQSEPVTDPVALPPTVDEMIESLERLKGQKLLIEMEEQAVKDALAKKLGEQNERLKKLGVEAKAEPPVTPLAKPEFEPSPDEAPAGRKEDVNPALPKGVRELQLESTQCKRSKVGRSISVFTSESQVEAELGEEEGKATWKQIDPKTEVLVVVGYDDTEVMPKYDRFEVQEVKADGSSSYRFKCGGGDPNGNQKLIHYLLITWPTRCKVYAVPKGSAVALD